MSAEPQAVSPAATVVAERSPSAGAVPAVRPRRIPARAGIGALRGVPARMGRARQRLDRGERRFPEQLPDRITTQSLTLR